MSSTSRDVVRASCSLRLSRLESLGLALALFAFAGCPTPDFEGRNCDEHDACPSGFACVAAQCRSVQGASASCVEGESQSCYPGPVKELGVGICESGKRTCMDGLFGACVGAEVAATERCNGLDDDCDGVVDDHLPSVQTCGIGACARTVALTCIDGVPGECVPGTPTVEICNGVDDDCDGEIDEGVSFLVSCGVGTCAREVLACDRGVPASCVPGTPSAEMCNGLDDDCDGVIDDGFGGSVVTCGVGACMRSIASCLGGETPSCTPAQPMAERCNGRDDDCDGMVDDGLAMMITCGVGACQRSVAACANGTPGRCEAGSPTTEICDGIDNDCDGAVDEWYGNLTLCTDLPTPVVSSIAACGESNCLIVTGTNFGPDAEVRLMQTFAPYDSAAIVPLSGQTRGADPRTSIEVKLPAGYSRQLSRTSGLAVQVVNVRKGRASNKMTFQQPSTLKFESAGRPSSGTCVQISEPSDPNGWNDNYLCSSVDLGLSWSKHDPIAGKSCVQIVESVDPDFWNDNYLCSDRPLGFRWSSAGKINGLRCVQFNEPADPHTWSDNYLCF